MTSYSRRLLLIVVILALAHANPLAWACSCAGLPDPTVNRESVFFGNAATVEYLAGDSKRSEPPIRVTFKVTRVVKGPDRNTIIVHTTYNRVSCQGYPFREGHSYRVAAEVVTQDDPTAGIAEVEGIDICGGTKLLRDAEDAD